MTGFATIPDGGWLFPLPAGIIDEHTATPTANRQPRQRSGKRRRGNELHWRIV